MLHDKGIIRNRLKIKAAIVSAQAFLAIRKEYDSFSKFIWKYLDNTPLQANYKSRNEIPAKTELSDKISADLNARGFKFVGSKVIYAFMQSTGMTNDHHIPCFRNKEVTLLSL